MQMSCQDNTTQGSLNVIVMLLYPLVRQSRRGQQHKCKCHLNVIRIALRTGGDMLSTTASRLAYQPHSLPASLLFSLFKISQENQCFWRLKHLPQPGFCMAPICFGLLAAFCPAKAWSVTNPLRQNVLLHTICRHLNEESRGDFCC